MPKFTEIFARKVPQTKAGRDKHWDSEAKTRYYQRDVGGQIRRILIGRFDIG